MKKVLISLLIFITILSCSISIVNAATTEDLVAAAEKTYTIAGEKVKIPEEYVVQLKKYLAEYPLSEEDGDKVIAKANEIIDIMNNEGVSDPTKLSEESKNKVKSLAQEIATIADVTINYDASDKSITILKNGKPYGDPIYLNMNKFVQTGSNNMVYIIVLGVAVIAIATIIGYRKIKENA